MNYVIGNDWESFKRSCDDLKIPQIGIKWSMTTGIVVTLEGVDADISKEEWKKIYDRLQPHLSNERHGILEVDPSPGRDRPNFERDVVLFIARYSGLTYRQALEEWNEKHPEDQILDETAARAAIDGIIDLMLPQEDWSVTIDYDDEGAPHYKSGGRDELRARFKQWLKERADQKSRAWDNPSG